MSDQMTDEKIYEGARRRVEAGKGFYKHLVVSLILLTPELIQQTEGIRSLGS